MIIRAPSFPLTLVSKPTTVYRDALEPSPLSNQPMCGDVFLLAMMRYAACLSFETPRPCEGPIGKTGFRHAVVTVLSSSLACADLGGRAWNRSLLRLARQRSHPEQSDSPGRLRAPPRGAVLSAIGWTTCFAEHRACPPETSFTHVTRVSPG
jgi:hypothetical protein